MCISISSSIIPSSSSSFSGSVTIYISEHLLLIILLSYVFSLCNWYHSTQKLLILFFLLQIIVLLHICGDGRMRMMHDLLIVSVFRMSIFVCIQCMNIKKTYHFMISSVFHRYFLLHICDGMKRA